MGMDVYGIKPTGQRGEYFRNNGWWWGPLADYCNFIAPDICAPCKGWHYNDGDGLDAAGAVALAEALQKEIDAGRTESYARRYEFAQERMTDANAPLQDAVLNALYAIEQIYLADTNEDD